MATKSEVMVAVLKLLEQGKPIQAVHLRQMGYARNTVSNALTQLVKNGDIDRHGHSSNCWYTSVGVELVTKKRTIGVPDLPDDLLFMMGYTRTEPGVGRYIKGDM